MCKEAKILLLISGIFTLAMGLSNVFVNIFLWKKSSSFLIIAQYNLMKYIFTPFAFIMGGWLSKRKNGIWALRVGIIFYILFFSCILLIKDNVINYIYPIGILLGIATGFYWLAYNVLNFDFTCTNNRDTFNGFNGAMSGIASAVTPFIAAYIIEKSKNLHGYIIVFGISLTLFVLLILISLTLRCEHYGEKLDFKRIISKNNIEWHNLRKSTIAWGLRDIVILFLINILIYETTGSEMALGKLLFISSLISSIAFIMEQKFIKPKRRVFSLHIGAIFMFIAVLGLVFKINYIFLVVFIIMDAIFLPFFIVPVSSIAFNTLDRNHEEDKRIEYIINRDIVLNIGRIISTSILIILLAFVENVKTLNYFLLFTLYRICTINISILS